MLPQEAAAGGLLALTVAAALLWTLVLPSWERRFATPARKREVERRRAARTGRVASAAWMTLFGMGSFGVPLFLSIDGLVGKPGLFYGSGVTFAEGIALPIQIVGILLAVATLVILIVVGRFIVEHIYGRATTERRLLTTGPFTLVRHPFYVQFVLYPLAIVMISLNYIALATIAYAVFDDRGPRTLLRWIREEEAEMRARYGVEYDRYATRTGRLFPRLRRSR